MKRHVMIIGAGCIFFLLRKVSAQKRTFAIRVWWLWSVHSELDVESLPIALAGIWSFYPTAARRPSRRKGQMCLNWLITSLQSSAHSRIYSKLCEKPQGRMPWLLFVRVIIRCQIWIKWTIFVFRFWTKRGLTFIGVSYLWCCLVIVFKFSLEKKAFPIVIRGACG